MKTNLSCSNCMAEIMFAMELTAPQTRDLFSCQTWWRNTDALTCAVVISEFCVNFVTEDEFFKQAEKYANCNAIFILKRSENGLNCTMTRIK